MNDFGNRISDLRKSKNMTQEFLAQKLDVTAQAVSKWERGESMPDVSLLPRLAEVFGVSIDSLFGVNQQPIVEYHPKEQRDFDKMILRITVDENQNHVKINLPFPLIKLAIQLKTQENALKFGNIDLSKIDFASVIQMIENGAVGKIVEIEADDGATVVIEVL